MNDDETIKPDNLAFDTSISADLKRIRQERELERKKDPLQAALSEIAANGFIGIEHERLTHVAKDRSYLLVDILADTVKNGGNPDSVITAFKLAQRTWVDTQQAYFGTENWFNLSPRIKAHVGSFNGWLANLSTDAPMQNALKTTTSMGAPDIQMPKPV